MSVGHRDRPPRSSDAVSAAYRAARFTDEPPAHVDAFILAAARQRRRHRYLPPLALAATLLLALGLLLRLAPPVSDVGDGAADSELRPMRPASEEPTPPRLLMQEADAPAPTSSAPEAAPAPARAPAAVTDEDVSSATQREMPLPPTASPPACAPERRGQATLWLECIRAQAAAGALEPARAEFAEFVRAYPSYPVPDEVTAALGR
jgi:hypothetical protein